MRLNQYKVTNALSPEDVDVTDFEDPEAEIDDYSESPDLCLSTLPFEVSPPWSAYGTSVIAQEKFASDSLPSVLPPARVFDLGWPHVHIILKWGEETSSFDRTASAITLANLVLDKIPSSHLSPPLQTLTKPSQLLLNALMNYKNLSTSVPALLLKLSSKLQDEELSQTFFLSLIKAAPSPPLKAILFNIYKKSSPTPANAAAVLTPFLDEMASLSSDSPDLIPTLMDSRDIYHECVIYLAQNPSAFDPSTTLLTGLRNLKARIRGRVREDRSGPFMEEVKENALTTVK
ncbi:hypothetical protein TrRE_jg5907, partial [Triparma retinervis]